MLSESLRVRPSSPPFFRAGLRGQLEKALETEARGRRGTETTGGEEEERRELFTAEWLSSRITITPPHGSMRMMSGKGLT